MAIQWNESHSVNVKEIDEQHKNFIRILNKMYDLVYQKIDQAKLKIILDELVAYAEKHFYTEEVYFDKFNYEHSQEHKEEHSKLKSQIKDFYKRFEAGEAEISTELLDFLENWLVDHLDIQDKKYINCFNEHGLF